MSGVKAYGGSRIEHMELEIIPDYEQGTVRVSCSLNLSGGIPGERCALAFNRGLLVTGLRVQGRERPYVQRLVEVYDHAFVPVNVMLFMLRHGKSIVDITYEGKLEDYHTIWSYVRDGITPAFSILRDDAFAFPQMVWRAPDGALEMRRERFTYDIFVRAPRGMTALCGGWAEDVTDAQGESIYHYVSGIPVGRVDVVIAPYYRYENKYRDYRMFLLKGTRRSAKRIATIFAQTDACRALMGHLFGKPRNLPTRLALIEVPNGFGGQMRDDYLLQQSYAFQADAAIDGLYHEISHGWTTARASGVSAGKRFFDEAFASYFQVLALRSLHGPEEERAALLRMQDCFVAAVQMQGSVARTTLAYHGQEQNIAYHKGAWMLCQLEETMGKKAFFDAMRDFIHTYDERAVDFPQFIEMMERYAPLPIGPYLNDWVYGVESSRWLLNLHVV